MGTMKRTVSPENNLRLDRSRTPDARTRPILLIAVALCAPALGLASLACDSGGTNSAAPEPPSGGAPSAAAPVVLGGEGVPIPTPTPPPPPTPTSVRNPDWPCAKINEVTLLGTSTERYDYEYTGPTTCSETPPDLDLIGCPTRETATVGPNTRTRTFRYDEANRLVAVEYSGGTRLTVLWSPDGTLTGMDVDRDGDGTRDDAVTYRHERNAIIWERDIDADGTADVRARYRLDPRGGRILGQENDRGADGSNDVRTEHTYEGARRVSSRDTALPAENVIVSTTYMYECPAVP